MPIYMKYASISGDVTDQNYSGWIEIDSFSFGASASNPTYGGSAGGDRAGKVSLGEIVVTKNLDDASVPLLGELFQGKVEGTGATNPVYVVFSKELPTGGGSSPYLKYTLQRTFVSQIQWSGPGDEGPEESLSIDYAGIDVIYYKENNGGTEETSFNFNPLVPN